MERIILFRSSLKDQTTMDNFDEEMLQRYKDGTATKEEREEFLKRLRAGELDHLVGTLLEILGSFPASPHPLAIRSLFDPGNSLLLTSLPAVSASWQ